ncbi:MAG: VTT domain-containing protein [Parcubacteria group bacterium]|nr:VTT domain-containing protein [Parcubacteria group bacterium]
MSAANFSIILPWVLVHGYLMIFVAIIIGGPIFISAAAFAAALGYFNVYFIFSLAFFGEITVDITLYLIGYSGRAGLVKKFGHYFGLTAARILSLEKLLSRHVWKALFIIKYSPIIPVPGFIIAGAARLEFKKFFYILFILSLPKAVFFTMIGYWFGRAYETFAGYFYYGQYLIVVVIILFIAAHYLFSHFSKKISEKK